MKRVAASEALILTVARAITGFESSGSAEWILARRIAIAPGFGPTSLGLLEETLKKGVVLELARRGSEPRAFLSQSPGSVTKGRLWERHATPALEFSEYPVELLRWMVAMPLRETKVPPLFRAPRTDGDHFFAYLAFDLCARTFTTPALVFDPSFRSLPLLWLAFVDHLTQKTPQEIPNNLGSLTHGVGAMFLEALQASLAKRWIEILKKSSLIESQDELIAHGAHVRRVLDRFLAAVAEAARPDLTGFLLTASSAILGAFAEPNRFIARLVKKGPLSEQVAARREAFAFVDALSRLRTFAEESRAVRFFDDNYDAAQLFLRLWETLGDAKLTQALRMQQDVALDSPA